MIEWFNKENTLWLRGVCALLVVLFHLSGIIPIIQSNSILNYIFYQLYFIPVAIFFFLSGFGLVSQYKVKGPKYINDFPKKRLFIFFMDYTLIVLVSALIDSGLNYKEFFQSFFFGYTIVRFGWYLQVTIWLYIFFYFVFKFCSNYKLLGFIICSIVYLILIFFTKPEYTYWQTIISFPIGILFGMYQKEINLFFCNFISKLYMYIYILTLSVYVIFYSHHINIFSNNLINDYIEVTIKSILTFITILCICYKYTIKNKMTNYLGDVSLEIYFMHGIIISIFACRYLAIKNEYLYSLVILILTLISAYFVKILLKKINTFLKRKITK